MAVNVELLCDVAEGGLDLAALHAAGTPATLKVTVSKLTDGTVFVTEYRKGIVITMTEEGAMKWVKRGIAKITDAPRRYR